ncbi:UNVERIFIED_CONTAM: hypothetical protein Sradi_2987000 [Sesamum radiatum]|uniref:Uncharacterized protein n=1 Tax=Sesamum radiatum TaxID=300843 RepID=A0AAW2S1E6_SESRA
MLDGLWVIRLVEYEKSLEFQNLLANCSLKYYHHGLQTCTQQFSTVSYPPVGMATFYLDEDAGLASTPKLDKELLLVVPESPLHVEQNY